jgi:hypothetical protein
LSANIMRPVRGNFDPSCRYATFTVERNIERRFDLDNEKMEPVVNTKRTPASEAKGVKLNRDKRNLEMCLRQITMTFTIIAPNGLKDP